MQITRLDAPMSRGGERPIWDAATQRLYYIDNFDGKVHSFAPETGACRTLQMPNKITTIVLRESGGVVATLRTGSTVWPRDG